MMPKRRSKKLHDFGIVPGERIFDHLGTESLGSEAARLQGRDYLLTIDALSAACIDLADENTELRRQLESVDGTQEWLKRLCVLAFILSLALVVEKWSF